MLTTVRNSSFLAAFLAWPLLSLSAPISLCPENPHYFLFRNRPLALITSGEHYGAVINSDFDYRRYLSTLHSDGLNYTRIFGGSYIEVPAQSFGILRNTLAPNRTHLVSPWARSSDGKFDLSQWNPEYFRRLHDFLSQAAAQDVVVELTFFSSVYDEKQWKVEPFNPANNVNHTNAIEWKKLHTLENGNLLALQESYVRKLVREAAAFDNVIFEIQNEPWSDRPVRINVAGLHPTASGPDKYPTSVEVADDRSLAWQSRVTEWISAEEAKLPAKHLIAQNICNSFSAAKTALANVAILNFHYAYPEAVSLNYQLNKAIAYDESGFLGRDDSVYLRQAWNFMLSGGSTFNNLDYSFCPGQEDGADTSPNGPGGGSSTLRRQLSTLATFLRSFSLVRLKPDTQVVQSADGARAHALSDGRSYGIYFDGSLTNVTLNVPAGEYRGEWLDPASGQTNPLPPFHHGRQFEKLTPPTRKQGWTFRLIRRS